MDCGRFFVTCDPQEEKKKGVIAASAGNHALALAWHGVNLGIPVTVVMPTIAPLTKVGTAVYTCRVFRYQPGTACFAPGSKRRWKCQPTSEWWVVKELAHDACFHHLIKKRHFKGSMSAGYHCHRKEVSQFEGVASVCYCIFLWGRVTLPFGNGSMLPAAEGSIPSNLLVRSREAILSSEVKRERIIQCVRYKMISINLRNSFNSLAVGFHKLDYRKVVHIIFKYIRWKRSQTGIKMYPLKNIPDRNLAIYPLKTLPDWNLTYIRWKSSQIGRFLFHSYLASQCMSRLTLNLTKMFVCSQS